MWQVKAFIFLEFSSLICNTLCKGRQLFASNSIKSHPSQHFAFFTSQMHCTLCTALKCLDIAVLSLPTFSSHVHHSSFTLNYICICMVTLLYVDVVHSVGSLGVTDLEWSDHVYIVCRKAGYLMIRVHEVMQHTR